MNTNRLKKKYVRVPSGKVKMRFDSDSPKKAKCAITKKPLQGTAYGKNSKISKLSKTQRRPEVVLGGVLSTKARDVVFEEAIKVKLKLKKIEDVKIAYRKYVKDAMNSVMA